MNSYAKSHMNEPLSQQLRSAGQEHLLPFLDALDDDARERLETQLQQLDLDLIAQLARAEMDVPDWGDLARRSTPPPAFRLHDSASKITPDQARQCGEEALRDGKVGAILVAGGTGQSAGIRTPQGHV